MEIIVPFKKVDFTKSGTHITANKFVLELQRDWEEQFHHKFKPYYANVIEGHPAAMQRLTLYLEGEIPEYDMGMELVDGQIDLDTNLVIEDFSDTKTVYALGSQFHADEDNPLFLVKNDGISDEILVLKYVPDDDNEEEEIVNAPVEGETCKIQ